MIIAKSAIESNWHKSVSGCNQYLLVVTLLAIAAWAVSPMINRWSRTVLLSVFWLFFSFVYFSAVKVLLFLVAFAGGFSRRSYSLHEHQHWPLLAPTCPHTGPHHSTLEKTCSNEEKSGSSSDLLQVAQAHFALSTTESSAVCEERGIACMQDLSVSVAQTLMQASALISLLTFTVVQRQLIHSSPYSNTHWNLILYFLSSKHLSFCTWGKTAALVSSLCKYTLWAHVTLWHILLAPSHLPLTLARLDSQVLITNDPIASLRVQWKEMKRTDNFGQRTCANNR